MYTARDVILAFHDRGFSDGDIATAIGSERATICKVRNQVGNYTGKIILPNLLTLAEMHHLTITRRPAVQPKKRASVAQRAAPSTKKPSTYTDLLSSLMKPAAQKTAAPARQQPPAAPRIVQPTHPGAANYQQVRCAVCPNMPPAGLKPAQFADWAMRNPCETRRRGQCPR